MHKPVNQNACEFGFPSTKTEYIKSQHTHLKNKQFICLTRNVRMVS